MRLFVVLALLALAGLSLTPPAEAQHRTTGTFTSGIKLRGNFHINRSRADLGTEVPRGENGYGAGVELNGDRLGLALYGFTAGRTADFDARSTAVVAVVEANYFFPAQALRFAPYLGVHSGLGTFTREYFDDPFFPSPKDGITRLGYQVGFRFQPIPLIGLDAQWRRQSHSAREAQDPALERDQVLVGVTLF